MNAAAETKSFADFKVADLALADWGRKEIAIAETEMPGLMAIREEFAPGQPLRGAARVLACQTTFVDLLVLGNALLHVQRNALLRSDLLERSHVA